MSEWEKMFWAVKEISRSSRTVEEGLRLTILFARSMSHLYDEQGYWDEVEEQLAQFPITTIVGWAKEGLENQGPGRGWDTLILDLGDCPETFRLYSNSFGTSLDEDRLMKMITLNTVVEYSGFEKCLNFKADNLSNALFSLERHNLVDEGVEALNNEVLNWRIEESSNWHGDNGYLLWLAFGSLALIEALREPSYCRRILSGRDKLYLLSGFEEILFHLDTVTAEGLTYNPYRVSQNLSLF